MILMPCLGQGVVEKVALLVTDSNHIPVENFVFKVSLKQLSKAGVPAQHLEFALRGFLLKLSVCSPLLSPSIPSGIIAPSFKLQSPLLFIYFPRLCAIPFDSCASMLTR